MNNHFVDTIETDILGISQYVFKDELSSPEKYRRQALSIDRAMQRNRVHVLLRTGPYPIDKTLFHSSLVHLRKQRAKNADERLALIIPYTFLMRYMPNYHASYIAQI